jgi:hypothetical protein
MHLLNLKLETKTSINASVGSAKLLQNNMEVIQERSNGYTQSTRSETTFEDHSVESAKLLQSNLEETSRDGGNYVAPLLSSLTTTPICYDIIASTNIKNEVWAYSTRWLVSRHGN